jgi:hypothetical protein
LVAEFTGLGDDPVGGCLERFYVGAAQLIGHGPPKKALGSRHGERERGVGGAGAVVQAFWGELEGGVGGLVFEG